MPLVHLEDDDLVDPLDDVRAHDPDDVPRDRASALTPEQRHVLSAIDDAEAKLAEAVAAHDPDAVTLAMERLENARDDALRAESRARDLRKAEAAAHAAEAAEKKAAHLAKADKVEARLRKVAPEIRLDAGHGRILVIRLGGDGFESGFSTEAVRRTVYALNQALASQLVSSRAAGRVVPLADWLSPMLTTEAGLLPVLQRGIARIEEN